MSDYNIKTVTGDDDAARKAAEKAAQQAAGRGDTATEEKTQLFRGDADGAQNIYGDVNSDGNVDTLTPGEDGAEGTINYGTGTDGTAITDDKKLAAADATKLWESITTATTDANEAEGPPADEADLEKTSPSNGIAALDEKLDGTGLRSVNTQDATIRDQLKRSGLSDEQIDNPNSQFFLSEDGKQIHYAGKDQSGEFETGVMSVSDLNNDDTHTGAGKNGFKDNLTEAQKEKLQEAYNIATKHISGTEGFQEKAEIEGRLDALQDAAIQAKDTKLLEKLTEVRNALGEQNATEAKKAFEELMTGNKELANKEIEQRKAEIEQLNLPADVKKELEAALKGAGDDLAKQMQAYTDVIDKFNDDKHKFGDDNKFTEKKDNAEFKTALDAFKDKLEGNKKAQDLYNHLSKLSEKYNQDDPLGAYMEAKLAELEKIVKDAETPDGGDVVPDAGTGGDTPNEGVDEAPNANNDNVSDEAQGANTEDGSNTDANEKTDITTLLAKLSGVDLKDADRKKADAEVSQWIKDNWSDLVARAQLDESGNFEYHEDPSDNEFDHASIVFNNTGDDIGGHYKLNGDGSVMRCLGNECNERYASLGQMNQSSHYHGILTDSAKKEILAFLGQ